MENQRPRVVIVGSGTRDVLPGRTAVGGAARYAARVAEAFGVHAGIVVLDEAHSTEADSALGAHDVWLVESDVPLVFEIRPEGDRRQMRVQSRPSMPVTLEAVPADWCEPELLVLGPLLPDDLDVASFLEARPRWTLLIAQGLLRAVGSEGLVSPLGRLPEVLRWFARPRTVLALSAEETTGWAPTDLDDLVAAGATVLLTEGSNGAEVITSGERFHVEPPAATPVDTIGAGDVFATAFACAIALEVVRSPREAGRLAAYFAAASIETEGPAALPSVGTMMARAGLAPQAIDAGAAG